jgi:DinB family protein
MMTVADYAKLPRAERLQRLERGPEAVAAVIRGHGDDLLARRPDRKNWAPKEVVCHMRDVEELLMTRITLTIETKEPKLVGFDPEKTPDRWAEERQYLRNDIGEALAAFRRRREESLALLRGLAPEQWDRSAIHPTRGRMTIDDFVSLETWHDENHLEQLKRALAGRV